jgi:thymidylate synthase ThyX
MIVLTKETHIPHNVGSNKKAEKIEDAWYEESESLDNATRSGKREECMRTVVPYSQSSSNRPFR